MLLKELGFADVGEGTVAAGLNVVDRTLRSWGVPMEGVRLVDASGLSNDNRVTCPTLLAVLQHVEGGPLETGLPVAGRTGTLADEFVGTPVEGRLTAKTGTLGNPPVDVDPPAVKGLAGYLVAPNGATIEFVMVLNGTDISNPDKYESYWSALAERLAAYPGGPAPASVGPR
jgi:D-alanyl-D-alanine carboxypeptidase/D-alanyl-D-alanine-endopeptidase (penicillin-binding protein 4)